MRGMQHRVLLRQIGCLTEKWHFHISFLYHKRLERLLDAAETGSCQVKSETLGLGVIL
jgi:hypothetical protein